MPVIRLLSELKEMVPMKKSGSFVGTKKLHLMGIRNAVSGIYDSRQRLSSLHLSPLPVCLLARWGIYAIRGP